MGAFFQTGNDRQSVGAPSNFLAFSWVLGLSAGSILGLLSHQRIGDQLFLPSFVSCFSFSSAFFCLLLPAALSYVLIEQGCPQALPVLVFLKGLCSAWIPAAVCPGSIGLFRFFYLFGSAAMIPVLWMWWLFLLHGNPRLRFRFFLLVCAAAALISIIEYTVISPFCLHTIFLEG